MADTQRPLTPAPMDTRNVVEVLYFAGCPNHQPLMQRLNVLLAETGAQTVLTEREVISDEQAETERFLGSPTVRVNGVDVEPGAAARQNFSLNCRLYQTRDGLTGAPLDDWIVATLLKPGSTDVDGGVSGSKRANALAGWENRTCLRFD